MEILASLLQFWDHEQSGIASKIVASATYDILKKNINFKPLFQRIGKMFKSDEQAEAFVKEVCERKSTGALGHDVGALFKEVTGEQQAPAELFGQLSEWARENLDSIKNLNNLSAAKSSGFLIGSQQAGRDINMIQGNYYSNPEKNED